MNKKDDDKGGIVDELNQNIKGLKNEINELNARNRLVSKASGD